jgi:hypothetical protein
MPSTSAKQHRFMAAIAHSPSFAKKVGVSQSVGKDFNAADKGKTFNKGGMMKKRRFAMGGDTEGGYRMPDPADIPAQQYSEEQEKYLGGADRTDPYIIARMKKAVPDKAASFTRAPSDLGNIDFDAKEDAKPDAPATVNKYYSDDLPEASGGRGKPVATAPVRKPKAIVDYGDEGERLRKRYPAQSTTSTTETKATPAITDYGDEGARLRKRYPQTTGETKGGAATGMASRKYKFKGTDEDKERNATNLAKELATTAALGGAGKIAQNLYRASTGLRTYRAGELAGPSTKLLTGPKAGEYIPASRQLPAPRGDSGAARSSSRWSDPDTYKANQAYDRLKNSNIIKKEARDMDVGTKPGYKKGGTIKKRRYGDGGMMKESKAMVGKEMAFMKKKGAPASMMKHEKAEMMGMKKGGMPMKDGKPMFMKKMNMGGMSSYAKGGGIESRGKTKGTMVRMATGGSVSSASRRADGIAQRGKTRC